MAFCKNCGAQLDDQAVFCTSCGANQNEAPQQPAYQQPVYQQPVYQQPVYQQPMAAQEVPAKGMGIAGMVLGILSLCLFCIWYLAIPCAIVSVILSGVANAKAKEVGAKNGMAVAGIVCSVIALTAAIIFVIIGVAALSSTSYYYGY